ELPSRSEVARAPFGIRLEAAAGEYNRPRLEFHRLSPLFHPHAEHTHAVINERDCPRFIEDLYSFPDGGLREVIYQSRPASVDGERKPPEELALAVDDDGLCAVVGHE